MKTSIIFVIIAAILTGCNTEEAAGPAITGDDIVVFEGMVTNEFLSFDIKGFYILGNGKCYSFHYDKSAKFRPANADSITISDLNRKFLNSKHIKTIPQDEIDLYKQMVSPLESGVLEGTETGPQEIDDYFYYGFIYNTEKKTYKPLTIQISGTYSRINSAREAVQLVEWLRGVYSLGLR